ncbi:MAG: ParB/RepB/Spo0J family partition protein [Pseudomonadota bacterium]
MAEDKSGKRLGRGLAALIGEMDQPVAEAQPVKVTPSDRSLPIEVIQRNPNNPRHTFREEDIVELAQSVRDHGLLQPIVVRPSKDGDGYEIIAGERRWRAAQRAELDTLPVIIRDVDDRVALELAIIENVQRADLNPIEEALGYEQLMREHAYTQGDLGDVIGKSRSHVANTLRLLKLPNDVRDFVSDGRISAGHARSLVGFDNPKSVAERIVRDGLSVRQIEELAAAKSDGGASDKPAKSSGKADKDVDTRQLEKTLSDATGYKVEINHKSKGGELRIRYKTLDQLDDLCRVLQSAH